MAPERAPGVFDVRHLEGSPGAGGGIPLGQRQGDLERTASRNQSRDGRRHPVVETDRTTQQRTPREPDGDSIGEAGETDRQRLGGRDHEERVGKTAAIGPTRCAPRRVRHGVGHGIHTDDQRGGIRGRVGQDRTTVAGPQIDDDPTEGSGASVELADVDVGQSAAGHELHPRTVARDVADVKSRPADDPVSRYSRGRRGWPRRAPSHDDRMETA